MATSLFTGRKLVVFLVVFVCLTIVGYCLSFFNYNIPSPILKSSTYLALEEKTVESITELNISSSTTNCAPTYLNEVKDVTKCTYKSQVFNVQQRGDFWVLYNYVTAEKTFGYHESITYTTHADFSFLDNVLPLVARWLGPISVALHAPGDDFDATLDSIAHLRACTDDLVKEYVTFHLYFNDQHFPKKVPSYDQVSIETFNCSLSPPYFNVTSEQMYKNQKKLLYPINVGRNIAREMARTHYVLPSDIELYPSHDIIPRFLQMIAEDKGPLLSKNPKVFPLHLFEVGADQQVPDTKSALQEMLASGTAIPFHKSMCPACHGIPKASEWQKTTETNGLNVFHVGKRTGKFVHWEPIFIGTNGDPWYDERLSWEGKSDKMTQGYALCVLDYDFLILDNAFLVHKPGIKGHQKNGNRDKITGQTNQLLQKTIHPQLRILYGVREGCAP